MKVIWQAEMKVTGIEPPSDIGGPAVLKLGLKGAMDGEALGNVGMMMRAPWVKVTIEQVQPQFFGVDPETGEVLDG
ncbi:MAG: hypothetical protein HW375_24 [Anaerolineales bacterium]|nr:hypothetical protein [Anaerolineales bacterium]